MKAAFTINGTKKIARSCATRYKVRGTSRKLRNNRGHGKMTSVVGSTELGSFLDRNSEFLTSTMVHTPQNSNEINIKASCQDLSVRLQLA